MKLLGLLIDELKLPPIENFDLDLYDKNASVETYCVKLSNLKAVLMGHTTYLLFRQL